jgi:hypothetical protein
MSTDVALDDHIHVRSEIDAISFVADLPSDPSAEPHMGGRTRTLGPPNAVAHMTYGYWGLPNLSPSHVC